MRVIDFSPPYNPFFPLHQTYTSHSYGCWSVFFFMSIKKLPWAREQVDLPTGLGGKFSFKEMITGPASFVGGWSTSCRDLFSFRSGLLFFCIYFYSRNFITDNHVMMWGMLNEWVVKEDFLRERDGQGIVCTEDFSKCFHMERERNRDEVVGWLSFS